MSRHLVVELPPGITYEQEAMLRSLVLRVARELSDLTIEAEAATARKGQAEAALAERDRRIGLLEAELASRPEAPLDEVAHRRSQAGVARLRLRVPT